MYRVSHFEFGLLSNDTLDQLSVGNLNNPSTKKNIPVKESVLDGSLGPVNANHLCGRCGKDILSCPGHVGKLNLFQPCVNVLFFQLLLKILPCICIRCGRVLLSDEQITKWEKQSIFYKTKIQKINTMCAKNKFCWFGTSPVPQLLSVEESSQVGYCGFRQPDLWIKHEKILLRPVYFINEPTDISQLPVITPWHIYQILKMCPNYTIFGLGSTLDCFFFQSLPIAPLLARPSRSAITEDDLTKNYRDIQKANIPKDDEKDVVPDLTCGQLRKKKIVSSSSEETKTEKTKEPRQLVEKYPLSLTYTRSKIGVIPICLNAYFNLQRAIARTIDSNFRVKLDEYTHNANGRDRLALKQRYMSNASHPGRVREMMNGKRVDLSGRAVISPDTEQDVDEVGIPLKNILKWDRPEMVHMFNYTDRLQECLNGPNVHPGANFVSRGQEKYIPNGNIGGLRLGDVVYRHPHKGEYVIENRAPSLHKHSIMAHRIRIHNDNTKKFHLSVTTPYGADFDGDEMTSHVPHDILSETEAIELISVGNNLVKDGKLIIGFVQHAVIGAYKLTQITTPHFTYQETLDRITRGNNMYWIRTCMSRWPHGKEQISGRELMCLLLPMYDMKDILTKSKLNQLFLLTIHTLKENEPAVALLSFLVRIFEHICFLQGITITLKDYIVQESEQAAKKVKQIYETANELSIERKSEYGILILLSRARDTLTESVSQELSNRNQPSGLLDIIQSNAKGTTTHIGQSTKMVGLQLNSNTNHRNTHYLNQLFHSDIEKFGCILRGFADGLSPSDTFYHLLTSRIAQIATSLNTSDSGYLYRRLWKFLEDLIIAFDGSLRNAQNDLILLSYGFDTTMLSEFPLKLIQKSGLDVISYYNRDETIESITETYELLLLRDQILEQRPVVSSIAVPIHLDVIHFFIQDHLSQNNLSNASNVSEQEARNTIQKTWNRLVTDFHVPNHVTQRAFFFETFSTRNMVEWGMLQHRIVFDRILLYVEKQYIKNVCMEGTPVGVIAAQQMTEPLSQTQLKRMAISGESTELVTGMIRMKEIVNFVESSKIHTPSMSICIKRGCESTFDPLCQLAELKLGTIVTNWSDEVHHPHLQSNCIQTDCKEHGQLITLCLFLNKPMMMMRKLAPRRVAHKLLTCSKLLNKDIHNVHLSYSMNIESDIWFLVVQIPTSSKIVSLLSKKSEPPSLVASQLHFALVHEDDVILEGISHITDFSQSRKEVKFVNNKHEYVSEHRLFYDTTGSNLLDICLLPEVDLAFTTTNDIQQIYEVFGIDACMSAIKQQVYQTMSHSASISMKHVQVIAHTMCHWGKPIPMTYAGMYSKLLFSKDVSFVKLATFERCMDSLVSGAAVGKKDKLLGVSERNFAGITTNLGTGQPTQYIPKPIPASLPNNWPVIKKKLKDFLFHVPNTDDILNQLHHHQQPVVLQLVAVKEPVVKKSKSQKRKWAEEAAKWGDIIQIIPDSPRLCPTLLKEEEWILPDIVIPVSP